MPPREGEGWGLQVEFKGKLMEGDGGEITILTCSQQAPRLTPGWKRNTEERCQELSKTPSPEMDSQNWIFLE